MYIILDKYEGIIHGVEVTYPDVTHDTCIFHLYNNLKSHYKGETKLKQEAFFGPAKAYTMQDFERYMRKLNKINKNITSYLLKTGYEKWTRVHSRNKKYSILTSNIAESMNAANKAARNLPVATLVECLRCLVQK